MEPLTIHLNMDEKAARERAIELLTLVGITDPESRLAQYPHQLSGGMRQRVMIAIGLACNPKLLIADEPTTALDVTIQAQILELMKDLSRRLGIAVIIITHNLGIVARYADRVNVMYAARLAESGTAERVFSRPLHPYARGLLAAVPRLDRGRSAKLATIDGAPPNLLAPPEGCRFRPRCPFAIEKCHEMPPFVAAEPGHLVACHRVSEIEALDPQAGTGGDVGQGREPERRWRRRHPRHHGTRASSFPSAAACSARRAWCGRSTTSRSMPSAAKRWAWSASRGAESRPWAGWCCGSTIPRPARSSSRAWTWRSSSAARWSRCASACRSSSRTRIRRSTRA